MRTYVINLRRSPERRRHMVGQLLHCGVVDYRFVEAVDGRELDMKDGALVDQAVRPRTPEWLRPGTVGCALSHLEVYERVLHEGAAHALVLEDDADLPGDIGALAESVAPHLHGAEVALLHYRSHYSSHVPCRMQRAGSVDLGSSRVLAIPVDVHQPMGSAGYVITAGGCARLLEGQRPVKAPPDRWGLFRDEGYLDLVRCVVPVAVGIHICRSKLDYTAPGSLRGRLLDVVDRNRVFPVYQLARRYREWRLRGTLEAVFDDEASDG